MRRIDSQTEDMFPRRMPIRASNILVPPLVVAALSHTAGLPGPLTAAFTFAAFSVASRLQDADFDAWRSGRDFRVQLRLDLQNKWKNMVAEAVMIPAAVGGLMQWGKVLLPVNP